MLWIWASVLGFWSSYVEHHFWGVRILDVDVNIRVLDVVLDVSFFYFPYEHLWDEVDCLLDLVGKDDKSSRWPRTASTRQAAPAREVRRTHKIPADPSVHDPWCKISRRFGSLVLNGGITRFLVSLRTPTGLGPTWSCQLWQSFLLLSMHGSVGLPDSSGLWWCLWAPQAQQNLIWSWTGRRS